jgi:restriction endonuclease
LNTLSWIIRANRTFVCLVFLVPLLIVAILWGKADPISLWLLFFPSVVCAFFSAALLISPPARKPKSKEKVDDEYPRVPKNLAQLHAMMDHTVFELFSAAVIVAMGEGHRFHEHTGGSGDKGVDTILYNKYGHEVVVQSKMHASNIPTTSEEMRDFLGAIVLHKANYGIFVTTSYFTSDAIQVVRGSGIRMHVIDGKRLDNLLRYKHQEIKLAFHSILNAQQDVIYL